MSHHDGKPPSERFPGLGRVLSTGKPGPSQEEREHQELEDFLNDSTPPTLSYPTGRVLGTGLPGPPLPTRPGNYGTFGNAPPPLPRPFPQLGRQQGVVNMRSIPSDSGERGPVRLFGNVHGFGQIETPDRPTIGEQAPLLSSAPPPQPRFPGTGQRLGGAPTGRSRLIPRD